MVARSTGVRTMTPDATYQAIPSISTASLTRSRLQLMAVPDAVGDKAPTPKTKVDASYCSRIPYTDKDGAVRINALDRDCISLILGVNDKNYKLTDEDAIKIGRWLENSQASDYWKRRKATVQSSLFGGTQIYGPLREGWDAHVKGKTLGAIAAVFKSAKGDNPRLDYQTEVANAPGIGSVLAPFQDIQKLLQLITDGSFLVGMVAVFAGVGLVFIAYPKVLG
jgi:hypothetical protein